MVVIEISCSRTTGRQDLRVPNKEPSDWTKIAQQWLVYGVHIYIEVASVQSRRSKQWDVVEQIEVCSPKM